MLNREEIIQQIEANIWYYQTHSTEDNPTHDYAQNSVDTLKELLEQIATYSKVFDVRNDMLSAEELNKFRRLPSNDE